MLEMLSVVLLGLFLGMRHATDADHVAAVGAIVTRERDVRGAAWLGTLWGVGHSATVLAVGGAIALFNFTISPRLGLSMEFSVAVMLVVLGGWSLLGPMRSLRSPTGTDSAAGAAARAYPPNAGLIGRLRPVLVGIVHGLAGSAAVALMIVPTIREPRWAIAYLAVFGLGTIAGMMLVTVSLALPFLYARQRMIRVAGLLPIAAGLASLGLGAFLMFQIGWGDGLFTATPRWSPH